MQGTTSASESVFGDGAWPRRIGVRDADGLSSRRRKAVLGDPVLQQQFEMDRTICQGEMQKANLSGVTFAGGGLAGVAAAAERGQAAGQARGVWRQKATSSYRRIRPSQSNKSWRPLRKSSA